MTKVVSKILQGIAVTHTTVKWVNFILANTQWRMSAKNYENRLAYVDVISEDKVGHFLRRRDAVILLWSQEHQQEISHCGLFSLRT